LFHGWWRWNIGNGTIFDEQFLGSIYDVLERYL